MPEADTITAAQRGDEAAFERLIAVHRSELHAHCYRMLGSVHDADDALQETLLAAWRGLAGFEGRSSLRSWLYRIATHACLRLAATQNRRAAPDFLPACADVNDLGDWMAEPLWLEPYPTPEDRYTELENVELAYVAALQHLPASQRAVLILREVLQFPAAEVAQVLDGSVASVNSSLQRARRTMAARQVPSQQAELTALGDGGRRELVHAFVRAWERADVPAMVGLLAEDARFSMPPLPAWFDGRAAVIGFMMMRMWETPWHLIPITASGQLAFACYQRHADGEPFRLGALNVVTLRGGRVAELTGFLDPGVHRRFGLAPMSSAPGMSPY